MMPRFARPRRQKSARRGRRRGPLDRAEVRAAIARARAGEPTTPDWPSLQAEATEALRIAWTRADFEYVLEICTFLAETADEREARHGPLVGGDLS
jgi:hypothetical protein